MTWTTAAEYTGWVAFFVILVGIAPAWFALLWPKFLDRVPPLQDDGAELPFISVLVAARDEAAAIEEALKRLLDLDYPRYEVVAVNDRSTDGTGHIMDRVASTDPRCRVVHIRDLPAEWLGKNHANWVAAQQATGEFLLFTDGDVLLDASILRRAMAVVYHERLDHLALVPDAMPQGYWEHVMLNYFSFMFLIATRSGFARFHWAKNAYVGIGAFNLVRASTYAAIGGHERLRMEVADDLFLGKLVKHAGYRQDIYIGIPLVRVRWQQGLWGIIRGLEKNAFTGVGYSLTFAVLAVIVQPLLVTLPFVLSFTGPAQVPSACITGCLFMSLLINARIARLNPLSAASYPVGALIFAFIIARSAWIILRAGGVTWRDTFYSLEALREARRKELSA